MNASTPTEPSDAETERRKREEAEQSLWTITPAGIAALAAHSIKEALRS